MLKGNLSSRPFYNERLVSAGLLLAAVLILALTAFNVYKLQALSAQRAELKARIDRNNNQAQQIEHGTATVQRSVDRATLVQLAESTQEANELIDQRAFSWTTFFGLIEKTMPFDLRLVSVAPRIERGNIRVTMMVVGRKPEDIDQLVDALQDTGSFYDLLAREKELNEDDNTYRGEVVGYYVPPNESRPVKRPAKPTKSLGRGRS
jgi:hypothetical protein